METIAARFQDTGHQIVKQGDAFVSRAREASIVFIGETRDAGLELFGAVRAEAKRWRRFAGQRAGALQSGLRNGLSLPAVERVVLTQVDETLKAIDSLVRVRLAQLERKPKAKAAKKTKGAKAQGARKSKAALPPIAA
ncbi:MAG: hypothetical protein ACRELB_21005 [Polyangiaceae bacterium]